MGGSLGTVAFTDAVIATWADDERVLAVGLPYFDGLAICMWVAFTMPR
jgi:hypothetical protein